MGFTIDSAFLYPYWMTTVVILRVMHVFICIDAKRVNNSIYWLHICIHIHKHTWKWSPGDVQLCACIIVCTHMLYIMCMMCIVVISHYLIKCGWRGSSNPLAAVSNQLPYAEPIYCVYVFLRLIIYIPKLFCGMIHLFF